MTTRVASPAPARGGDDRDRFTRERAASLAPRAAHRRRAPSPSGLHPIPASSSSLLIMKSSARFGPKMASIWSGRGPPGAEFWCLSRTPPRLVVLFSRYIRRRIATMVRLVTVCSRRGLSVPAPWSKRGARAVRRSRGTPASERCPPIRPKRCTWARRDATQPVVRRIPCHTCATTPAEAADRGSTRAVRG